MLSPGADRQTRGSSLFQRPGKLKEASRRDFHSPSATDRHRHRHRQGTSCHCQESYLDLLILFANATIISTNVGSPSAPDQTCFCSTMLMPLSTMFSSQRDWRRKKLQQLCSFGRRENHRYRQYVTKYCVTFAKFIINVGMNEGTLSSKKVKNSKICCRSWWNWSWKVTNILCKYLGNDFWENFLSSCPFLFLVQVHYVPCKCIWDICARMKWGTWLKHLYADKMRHQVPKSQLNTLNWP